MGYESNWAKTTDVVRNHYGQRGIDEQFGGQASSSDETKTIFLNLEFNDVKSAGGRMASFIPAGARIVTSTLRVKDAWVGGTGITFGTYDGAGLAVISEGFVTDTATAGVGYVDNLTVDLVAAGDGTLNTLATSIISEDSYVGWDISGTFTAGSATLEVKYIEERHV